MSPGMKKRPDDRDTPNQWGMTTMEMDDLYLDLKDIDIKYGKYV